MTHKIPKKNLNNITWRFLATSCFLLLKVKYIFGLEMVCVVHCKQVFHNNITYFKQGSQCCGLLLSSEMHGTQTLYETFDTLEIIKKLIFIYLQCNNEALEIMSTTFLAWTTHPIGQKVTDYHSSSKMFYNIPCVWYNKYTDTNMLSMKVI